MPPDLWEEQAYFDDLNRPKFRVVPTRPLLSEDWERSKFYARRVRFLGSHDWRGVDYTELFATVAFCPPPEGFFPILHGISWHYKSAAGITLPDFRPFLGPSVSSVAFDTLSPGSHLSLLPHIGQRYPRLKKLEIGFNFNLESPQDRQVSAVSMLVRSLHALESLQLDQLDQAALEHIGRLPTLKSLTAHQLPARLRFSTTLAGSMFPALRTFNIFVGGIQPVTALITLASASPLRVFHVEFPECPTSVQLHEFTTALTTHCDHTEMEWLTVQLAEEPVPPHAALYSLQPLSCFVNVLRVEITSSIGFDLDDEKVSVLAHAWPQLTQLLLSSMERPHSVNVTLASVRTLAQLCPHLEELQLCLDARIVPALDSATRIHQNSLRRLNVDSSAIVTPMAVANFLSALFPKLSTIRTDREWVSVGAVGIDQAHHQRWKEVETLIPQLLKIREQERLWERASN